MQETLNKIDQVFSQLRPMVQRDGGDIEFVKFEQGIVYVRMHGACVGCPASMYTLKLGLEDSLKEQVPGVTEVVQVD
ncbi:MAG: NifU family protein [Candidatus Dependentiae bacterium]|nr:NifU family protein [Candidatus Dependentiae bacterium]